MTVLPCRARPIHKGQVYAAVSRGSRVADSRARRNNLIFEQGSAVIELPDVDTPSPPGSEIEWELVFVTPEMADELCSNNQCNTRPPDEYTSAKYGEEIEAGAFGGTHQALATDEHGCLLDGWHRCNAIRKTGIGVWLWIARNVKSEMFPRIDRGKVRSFADVHAIDMGIPGPDAKILTAAVAICARVDARMSPAKWRQRAAFKPSAQRFRELTELYNIPVSMLEFTNPAARGSKIQKSVVLAGAYLIRRKNSEMDVKVFLQGLSEGLNDDAMKQLRDHVRQLSGERKKAWNQYIQLSAVLHTWNTWQKGAKLRSLQPSAFETMPAKVCVAMTAERLEG